MDKYGTTKLYTHHNWMTYYNTCSTISGFVDLSKSAIDIHKSISILYTLYYQFSGRYPPKNYDWTHAAQLPLLEWPLMSAGK